MDERFDAIVIGGGPGGSTVGALLGQAGRRVCVLEKERFPRFHVGESLLPYNLDLFARLGVLPELERRDRWMKKEGAVFSNADGSVRQTYYFSNTLSGDHTYAWHVERAAFDHLLLRNAARLGAEVREGWRVTEPIRDGARVVGVRATDPAGAAHALHAAVVVDASGRDTFLAGEFGLKTTHPAMRKGACFAHFDGVPRGAGRDAGNIILITGADGWAWVIPFASGRTSVGLVLHARRWKERTPGETLETFFDATAARIPVLADLLRPARRVGPVHPIGDISYTSRAFAGPGWVLVGDAAVFLDPIFSTGVYLAMVGGELVADAIADACARGATIDATTFRAYDRRIHRAHKVFFPLIEGFYDPAFFDRFTQPVFKFRIQSAMTSVLAGDVFRWWPQRPLLSAFWLGVRQARKARVRDGQPAESLLGA